MMSEPFSTASAKVRPRFLRSLSVGSEETAMKTARGDEGDSANSFSVQAVSTPRGRKTFSQTSMQGSSQSADGRITTKISPRTAALRSGTLGLQEVRVGLELGGQQEGYRLRCRALRKALTDTLLFGEGVRHGRSAQKDLRRKNRLPSAATAGANRVPRTVDPCWSGDTGVAIIGGMF